MNFKVEELPTYRIAYIRRLGAYGADNVEVMERLKKWAKAQNLYNEQSIILAISHDNPQIIKKEKCRYDACITLSSDCKINFDDNIKEGNILGGKYSVFQVEHTVEALKKAWIEIFPALQNKNFCFDINKPIIERYQIKMVDNHFCEICVPIL